MKNRFKKKKPQSLSSWGSLFGSSSWLASVNLKHCWKFSEENPTPLKAGFKIKLKQNKWFWHFSSQKSKTIIMPCLSKVYFFLCAKHSIYKPCLHQVEKEMMTLRQFSVKIVPKIICEHEHFKKWIAFMDSPFSQIHLSKIIYKESLWFQLAPEGQYILNLQGALAKGLVLV